MTFESACSALKFIVDTMVASAEIAKQHHCYKKQESEFLENYQEFLGYVLTK